MNHRVLELTIQTNGQTDRPTEWVSSVLRPHQHSIGYMGDGFYRSKTQPTVSKYWRRKL